MDRRLGVNQPPGFPFNLNSAVDTLLKREFDLYRDQEKPHPVMKLFGVQGIPFKHPELDRWRDSLRGGIQHHHTETNFVITGGVDDLWIDSSGWLNVVDYKATSKTTEVTLDAGWQNGYKRQMEIYQWLFRRNNFKVSDTGYFVYCNGNASTDRFDGCLRFDIKVIPYGGNDCWIEDVLFSIKRTLSSDEIPSPGNTCDYCAYIAAISEALRKKNVS